MKVGLWNIRADNLKAMQCSLADTSDKKEWQKEINVIDNALEYIDQLESDKQKLIEKLEEDKIELTEELKYNSTKREARMQLNLVNKYLEILKGE